MATTEKEMAHRKTGIMFVIPVKLKAIIEKRAKDEDISVSYFIRKAVAEFVGYTLTPEDRGRVTKYASPEERVAAQKARETERRDIIKRLLAKYKSGEITLDEIEEDEDTDEVEDMADEEREEVTA